MAGAGKELEAKGKEERKPWHTPRLVEYGRLSRITKDASASTGTDMSSMSGSAMM